MCQPKPGPRCAGHLAEHIAKVKQQLAENEHAFVTAGHNAVPHPLVSRGTLAMLQEEYDETPTGQRELQAQIDAAVGVDHATQMRRETLRDQKNRAAGRYETKKAALAAHADGDERRAKIILKHGADNGWLEHSKLKPLSATSHNTMAVEDGEAYGIEWTDTYTDYDDAGQPARVTEHGIAWETPLRPGPTPGTWLTGTERSATRSDPMLFTESTIDQPDTTLRAYDPATGQPYGSPVDMDDLDVPGRVNDFTEHRECDNYDERWDADPEVVRDADGRPVLLRYTGTAVAVSSEAYGSRVA